MSTPVASRLSGNEIMLAICGTECASCEGRKERGHTFCNTCFQKLPEQIKADIAYGMRILSAALRSGIAKLEG